MKIYLDTVGCRLNQSEIEAFARQFRAAGHELVADPSQADLAVINTCTVTAAAAADSRKKIRGMERAGIEKIAVTGCWATMEPAAAARLPGVSQVISNTEKDDLVWVILGLQDKDSGWEPQVREPIPGERSRTRAFIKVQDGCDNRCTFCITTLARGPGRSRPIPDVIQDVQSALMAGDQEIVLSGVHLGSWGQDFSKPANLPDLIRAILEETATLRLRLSSLEPWDIDEGFFALWQDTRLANHLHLPLQSGCAATLKRMARKTTPEAYAALLKAARDSIKDVAITTDIITGFPSETEDEFRQSLDFIAQMGFARGHVFTYSERPGTAAARMPGSIAPSIRKARSEQVRQVLARSERTFQGRFLGDHRPVLWERVAKATADAWSHTGWTDNYLRVTASFSRPLWNRITMVKITAQNSRGMIGEVLDDRILPAPQTGQMHLAKRLPPSDDWNTNQGVTHE